MHDQKSAAAVTTTAGAAPTNQSTNVDVTAERKAAAEGERTRVLEITATCKTAGKLELADKFIEAGSSIHDVRAELLTIVCKERAPIAVETTETVVTTQVTEDEDENSPFKKEYAQNSAKYKKLGTSEADYIKSRRIDEGLDQLMSTGE